MKNREEPNGNGWFFRLARPHRCPADRDGTVRPEKGVVQYQPVDAFGPIQRSMNTAPGTGLLQYAAIG